MAHNIPSHIDELLWRVAEAKDADLTADFLRRYPAMESQLAARSAMVDSIRGARPVPPIATRFVPAAAAAPRPRFWIAPVAVGLLVGLAIASYQIAEFAQGPEISEPDRVVVPQSPIPTPGDGRVITPTQPPTTNYDPGTVARPEELPTDDRLVVLSVNGTTLFGALNAIKEKGVNLEIMPGVEDMPLTLAANRDDGTIALEPMQMLQAVKTAAGFELVDNGPEGLLILPSENTTVIGEPRVRENEIGGN
jgi:hypothetical protein